MPTDTPYSNRELDAKFENIKQVSLENRHALRDDIQNMQNVMELRLSDMRRDTATAISGMQTDVTEIVKQTKATNGRVNKLEKWQSYVIGFCACLTLIAVPILFMLLNGRI